MATKADLLARGGAQWNAIAATQGAAAADAAWSNAIREEQNLPPLDTSTLSIFTNQILTDPLEAPLDSANSLLGNTLADLIKSPLVLIAGAVAIFFALGGLALIKRK